MTIPKSSPQYLGKAVERVAHNPSQTRLAFIEAWSKWAEGNYLEPDMGMGTELLEAIRDEVFANQSDSSLGRLLASVFEMSADGLNAHPVSLPQRSLEAHSADIRS
jgi:hypothetical protein